MTLRLLVAMTQRVTSQGFGDIVAQVRWYIDFESLEKLIPSLILQQTIKSLDEGSLSNEERRALDAFHEAIKRKELGKKGDAIFDLE